MNCTELDACLAVQRMHASLQLKLDDVLGTLHGLGWSDFALLDALAAAPEQRLALRQLVRPLGVPPSGVVRRIAPLEKVGLLQREGSGTHDRVVVLRPGGLRLWREARETAADICANAWRGTPVAATLVADLHAIANSPALS